MTIDGTRLKEDGFTDEEVRQISEYCQVEMENDRFCNEAAAIIVGTGEVRLVCRTIAEIIDKLRPGSWIMRDLLG